MIIINKNTGEYFAGRFTGKQGNLFSKDYRDARHLKRRFCSKIIEILIVRGYDVEIGEKPE